VRASVARLLVLWRSALRARFIHWMERHPVAGRRNPPRRARRWAREILLALLLTIAAAAFITVAWLRGDGAPHHAPAFETARKPAVN
jgi:hypothetical protein